MPRGPAQPPHFLTLPRLHHLPHPGRAPPPPFPSSRKAGSPTLVMDAALTIERRCFLGFPTSKSSSSRSCGDRGLRPGAGKGPPSQLTEPPRAPAPGMRSGWAPSPHPRQPHRSSQPAGRYLPGRRIVAGLLLGGEALGLLLGVIVCGRRARKVGASVFRLVSWPCGSRAALGGGLRFSTTTAPPQEPLWPFLLSPGDNGPD